MWEGVRFAHATRCFDAANLGVGVCLSIIAERNRGTGEPFGRRPVEKSRQGQVERVIVLLEAVFVLSFRAPCEWCQRETEGCGTVAHEYVKPSYGVKLASVSIPFASEYTGIIW